MPVYVQNTHAKYPRHIAQSEHFQLHAYILPLMQGFCQVARFSIPETDGSDAEDVPVEYVLISRRSRNRPGLRYQRRGVDEEAHVANFVETEAILRVDVGSMHALPQSVLLTIARSGKKSKTRFLMFRFEVQVRLADI